MWSLLAFESKMDPARRQNALSRRTIRAGTGFGISGPANSTSRPPARAVACANAPSKFAAHSATSFHINQSLSNCFEAKLSITTVTVGDSNINGLSLMPRPAVAVKAVLRLADPPCYPALASLYPTVLNTTAQVGISQILVQGQYCSLCSGAGTRAGRVPTLRDAWAVLLGR